MTAAAVIASPIYTAFAHALAARLRGRIVALAALPWLDKPQREQLGQRENVPDAPCR